MKMMMIQLLYDASDANNYDDYYATLMLINEPNDPHDY